MSCTHNKKLYSVCASTSLNETNGYLYYAVTKNGHLEMAFPAKKQHPKGIFTYSMQRRGGELSFTNDGFTYRFYSDVGGNGAIEGDSIHIDKGGKKISSFNCERTIYDTGMAMTPVENLMTSAGLAK